MDNLLGLQVQRSFVCGVIDLPSCQQAFRTSSVSPSRAVGRAALSNFGPTAHQNESIALSRKSTVSSKQNDPDVGCELVQHGETDGCERPGGKTSVVRSLSMNLQLLLYWSVCLTAAYFIDDISQTGETEAGAFVSVLHTAGDTELFLRTHHGHMLLARV